MLLKFLLFLFFVYLLFRVVNFFFKVVSTVSGAKKQANFNRQQHSSQRRRNGHGHQSSRYRKPSDGNVNIEYIPEDDTEKNGKGPRNFKGGEYVDYEEVK